MLRRPLSVGYAAPSCKQRFQPFVRLVAHCIGGIMVHCWGIALTERVSRAQRNPESERRWLEAPAFPDCG